jgi:hypothetical protein
MQSGAILVDHRPPQEAPHGDVGDEPCGRFSFGIERLPDSEAKHHVGRFCDGIAAPVVDGNLRVGHFSTGVERDPVAPSVLRHGSFADGYELVGRP